MSIFQSFKRLIIEDFPEKDRPLVSKIAYTLNTTLEDILNGLNKNLSIEDNLNLNKRDFTTTVDANGVPINSVIIKSGLASACRGILTIRAVNNTTPGMTPTGTPFITFSDNGGLITISKISNLQANQSYTLRIVLFP